MTPFGKKEIIMYLFTQDERSLELCKTCRNM